MFNALLSNPIIFNSGYSFLALFLAFVLAWSIKKLTDLIFWEVKHRSQSPKIKAKTKTLRWLFKNIIDAVIGVTVVFVILSKWGLNIMPLITGAGILGLAISFGSQSLVKDIIAGFFIIVEDQFDVGDFVKIDKYEGEVYKITLRLTVLQDIDGHKIYIPNSSISSVVKMNKKASKS